MEEGAVSRFLLGSNTLLVFVLCLVLLPVLRRAWGRQPVFAITIALEVGSLAWLVEYVLRLFPGLMSQRTEGIVDAVLNTAVVALYAFAGWALLRMEERFDPSLALSTRPTRQSLAWGTITSNAGLALVISAFIALMILSIAASPAPVAGHAQAWSASIGFSLLAWGLWRELTRSRHSTLIGLICAGSVFGYAALQLFQNVPIETPEFMVTRMLAVIFKVCLVFTLATLDTLVAEARGVARDQVGVLQALVDCRAQMRRIHDNAKDRASALAKHLELLSRLPQSSNPSVVPGMLKDAVRQSAELVATVEELLVAQRTPWDIPVKEGLEAAIQLRLDLLEDETRSSSRPIRTSLLAEPRPLPRVECEVVYLEIAAEALRNAAKHAEASHVHVVLRATSNTFELSIQDNGRGLASPSNNGFHFGLQNIRQLARGLGAIPPVIQSTPGGGTRVAIIVPLQEEYGVQS